ncbi:hypothetical protein V8B97DRAFT_2031495 [Scleroderma yunnanense]
MLGEAFPTVCIVNNDEHGDTGLRQTTATAHANGQSTYLDQLLQYAPAFTTKYTSAFSPHKAPVRETYSFTVRLGYSHNGTKYVEGDGERWIGCKCRFEIVVERMELTGYQVYAVEKWIVERTRPVTVLTVYTGDPSHKIIVTALSPVSRLPYSEAELEFTTAVQHLRKQVDARPKEIPQGTLMVTSLAHFRSDYTIVHIPDGDFLAVQDKLYSNINLLRMGCSGRGAVTLDEPSEATKDRFKSVYFLSDTPVTTFRSKPHSHSHSRAYSHPVASLSASPAVHEMSYSNQPSVISPSHSNASQPNTLATLATSRHPHFTSYVLELVKILQAALAICGMFPLSPPPMLGPVFDGLLCDATVDGLRKWGAEVGENFPGFEATERIADPNTISLLLSFVLSTRNKLATLVQGVPKDPFLHPHEFLAVISSYAHSQLSSGHSATAQCAGAGSITSAPTSPSPPSSAPFAFNLSGSTSSSTHVAMSPSVASVSPVHLTLTMYTTLNSTHERLRHTDSRRVQRAILSRLEVNPTSEEDATDEERKGLGGRVMGLVGRTHTGAGSVVVPTTDLGGLARVVLSGRDREKVRERKRERERERGKERDWGSKDGERWKERVGTVDEKEKVAGSLSALWSGRVEMLVRMRERAEGRWIYCTRHEQERERDGSMRDKPMPSDVDDPVMKSNGEDDIFGGAWSGKVQKRLEMWTGINRSKRSVDLSGLGKFSGRTSSVAIPLSAQSSSSGHIYPPSELKGLGIPSVVFSNGVDEDDIPSSGQVSPISVSRSHIPLVLTPSAGVSSAHIMGAETEHSTKLSGGGLAPDSRDERMSNWDGWGRSQRIQKNDTLPRRRHSFHDLSSIGEITVLRKEWMRIDVELCGQIVVMRRREEHLRGVLRCLEHLTNTLALTNTSLRMADTDHMPIVKSLTTTPSVQDAPSSHHDVSSSSILSDSSNAVLCSSPHPISLAAILQMIPTPPPVAALQYETAQLRVGEMWAGTRALRAKVWELRARVFGDGSTSGASGSMAGGLRRRSSRLRGDRERKVEQWMLDGGKRLVDAQGRSEEEAEEERRAAGFDTDTESIYDGETESDGGHEGVSGPGEGDGEGEGDRQWVMPMWLLRMFTSWGSQLGFLRRGSVVTGVGDVTPPSGPMTGDRLLT